MAASGCVSEACRGTKLSDPSNKHGLEMLGISRKNGLSHQYCAKDKTRLYLEKNGLKLTKCANGNVCGRKAMNNGVVTGLLINKCSSLKISSKSDLNGDLHFKNSRTLICNTSNGICRSLPESPEIDCEDYFSESMVAGHHLEVTSASAPLSSSPRSRDHNCLYSGILPSPPSCGDSFKSVSSPESEFAEQTPPPEDEHHISSLCSLTVPDVFKNGSQSMDIAKTWVDTPPETASPSEPEQKPCDLKAKQTDNSSPSQVACKWRGCETHVEQSDVVEHIRDVHMNPQMSSKSSDRKFVCLWRGCKVFNKPSSSWKWLEHHTVSHGGHKPFKCIVDGCGSRFTSKNALERHVNSHFKISSSSSNSKNYSTNGGDLSSSLSKASSSSKPLKEESPSKGRRKRIRNKRSWWKAKTEDFFDSGIMEHLRHRVTQLNKNTNIDICNSGRSITIRSEVLAKRTEENGRISLLLRWHPENILPDSWEPESEVKREKSIPIRSLPHDVEVRKLLSLSPFISPKAKRKR